jgi:hypothetical protein
MYEACAWFNSTYKALEDAWKSIKLQLREVTLSISEQDHRIEIQGSGSIECWSLVDPDSGRGPAVRSDRH